jgi:hypothetical protein
MLACQAQLDGNAGFAPFLAGQRRRRYALRQQSAAWAGRITTHIQGSFSTTGPAATQRQRQRHSASQALNLEHTHSSFSYLIAHLIRFATGYCECEQAEDSYGSAWED